MIENSELDLPILSTFDWNNWFIENDKNLLHIPYEDEDKLSDEEINMIKHSLQVWQLGEGSPGNNLRKQVKQYVEKNGRHDFAQVMEKLLMEEKRHSQLLSQFMSFHGIALKNKMFIDNLFRFLRKIGGLQCSIIMLITGEIIALSYYKALSEITTSEVLPVICKQMIQDELMHIALSSDTLYKFALENGSLKNGVVSRFRNVGLFIAVMIAWKHFKQIFINSGCSFNSFYGTSKRLLNQSKQIVRNKLMVNSAL